jgi:quercetin dioxygenase-like cupin family protein
VDWTNRLEGATVPPMTDGLELHRLGTGEGRKLVLLGDIRTVKASAAETDGQLTVVEQVVEPGAGSALHRHPYQEFFYVLEGVLEFSGLADGERVTFTAPAGATVHAGSGVPHAYRNAGSARARFLAVMQPAGAEGFFAEVGRWLDEDGDVETAAPSADEVRQAAARHGIEFLPDP